MENHEGEESFLPELWKRNFFDTFGLPPILMERKAMKIPWRGVRFGNVLGELYFEQDAVKFSQDAIGVSVCAGTRSRVDGSKEQQMALDRSTSDEVLWGNMMSSTSMYYEILESGPPEFREAVLKGLSNAVPIEELSYEMFTLPTTASELSSCSQHDSRATLTVAVSYTHRTVLPGGVLKADEYQLEQFKSILNAIKKNRPRGIRFVRIWTDQVLSARLRASSEDSSGAKWILYGLLPYAMFTVAVLFPKDGTDIMSMWSSCEQILADGGLGCIFSTKHKEGAPPFCKDRMEQKNNVAKTVGDGLSVYGNLRRLSGIIHAGVLEDTLTFHIRDAQLLGKLAYFIARIEQDDSLPISHGFECTSCLNATHRELLGFMHCMKTCADKYSDYMTAQEQKRYGFTQLSLPYPRVRARHGYTSWNGIREFVPGAGRFAKGMYSANGLPSSTFHLIRLRDTQPPKYEYARPEHQHERHKIAVLSFGSETDTYYIALYLRCRGMAAEDKYNYVFFSMRVNIIELDVLHSMVEQAKNDAASGLESFEISTLFRHPVHGHILEGLVFRDIVPMKVFADDSVEGSASNMPLANFPGLEHLGGLATHEMAYLLTDARFRQLWL